MPSSRDDSLRKVPGDAVLIRGASSRVLAEMGVFVLEDKQKRVLQYLIKIAKNMIFEQTNVINLKESLQTKTCKTLNMFIQSNSATYAIGKFKNPLDPSHSTSIAVIPDIVYKTKYESDRAHKDLCNAYISFMLRFTTLVCALLSSVYVNKDMASLYRAIQEEGDPTRPLPAGEERVPMPQKLLDAYVTSGWFHQYKTTSLYFFAPPPKKIGESPILPRNPVFWDVLQGLVYARDTLDTTVRFRFDTASPSVLTPGYSSQPSYAGYAGYAGYNPLAGRNAGYSSERIELDRLRREREFEEERRRRDARESDDLSRRQLIEERARQAYEVDARSGLPMVPGPPVPPGPPGPPGPPVPPVPPVPPYGPNPGSVAGSVAGSVGSVGSVAGSSVSGASGASGASRAFGGPATASSADPSTGSRSLFGRTRKNKPRKNRRRSRKNSQVGGAC